MKINYIGIVAGIVAFISLVLPWWTMAFQGTVPVEFLEVEVRGDISVFTYNARGTIEAVGWGFEYSEDIPIDLWFGWAAFALIIVTGVTAIAGGLIVGEKGKIVLVVAGILALLSVVIFAAGLQGELSEEIEPGYPKLSLFSSGSFSQYVPGIGSVWLDYSTYLTFGFWMAVVATVLTFVSLLTHPTVAPPLLPPPPAVPQEPPQAPLPSLPAPTPAPTTPPKIHCIYCGAENPPNADFCLKCGKKMIKP